jgi:hypothetical protein
MTQGPAPAKSDGLVFGLEKVGEIEIFMGNMFGGGHHKCKVIWNKGSAPH